MTFTWDLVQCLSPKSAHTMGWVTGQLQPKTPTELAALGLGTPVFLQIIKFVYLFVCVLSVYCMCVMHTCECVCIHTCIQRPEQGTCLSLCITLCLTPLRCGFSLLTKLAGQRALWSVLLNAGVPGMSSNVWLFMRLPGI